MDQQLWSQIRRLCLVENLSQREVARRLMIDRGTVKRALKMERFTQRRVKKPGIKIRPA